MAGDTVRGGGGADMERAVHLLISGRVQGVFYRYTAQKMALRLNLRGWVRNLPDGKVEAVAVGDPDAVDAFVNWCREGPPGAHVTHVEVEELSVSPEALEGFSIVY